MPRLREVPRAEVTDERILFFYDRLFAPDRDPAVDHGTATGTPGDWWTVFAQDPDVFRHAVRGFALYRGASLDPALRELGQCRAGWARGSQFVFSQHCKQMRALKMPEEKIEAIPHWQTADCYTPLERALLAYTDGLVLDGGRVADAVFDVLREHLSDREILQFTYITCMYDMHAVMSKALRVEYDNREEPIVEVAAPEGYGDRDISDDLAGGR
ncbi:carboxymuconolactone decarboxylase family protein [Actinomadura algeriensis]|uniref:Alkylhydroperoxidase family enzyme n=1 Tax=Actinomadura algeriensis TaxID=1679523 RepID=A0ABR9JN32_9ACTN|nr:carboxymuconolactone decarboxylase family protein [Actinomadura algeriensis]MBE1531952.1 alkylhydroperoxidase family enzyme [Actinomadura algeriensis]